MSFNVFLLKYEFICFSSFLKALQINAKCIDHKSFSQQHSGSHFPMWKIDEEIDGTVN